MRSAMRTSMSLDDDIVPVVKRYAAQRSWSKYSELEVKSWVPRFGPN
jgi:hypothetical protein